MENIKYDNIDEDINVETKQLISFHNNREYNLKINNNYLAICRDKQIITFYDFKKRELKEYFKIEFDNEIIDFELNLNYPNILLVAKENKVELYEIPELFNKAKIKINPKFVYSGHKGVIKYAIFNPKFSHIISTLSKDNYLNIWNIQMYNTIKYYSNSVKKMLKWENNGNLIGFYEDNYLKIFNRKTEIVEFSLEVNDSDEIDYEFLSENICILIFNSKALVQLWKFRTKDIINKNIDHQFNGYGKINDYFILYSNEFLHIYTNDEDFEFFKKIKLQKEVTKLAFILNKNYTKENLIEMIDFNFSQINLISVNDQYKGKIENNNSYVNYNNNNTQNKNMKKNEEDSSKENYITTADEILKDREDNLNEDYFKGCILDISNIYDILKYNNNEEEIFLVNKKVYFEIDTIKNELDNQSKNLISLKNFVIEEIKKEKVFKDLDEEYLYYIKLLIKNNVEKTLITKYLKFLKKLEDENLKINYPHESFNDELKYYLPLFEENEIKDLKPKNFISEKSKFIDLLNKLSNIDKDNFEEYKKKIENNFYIYNQPISLDSKESIFFRCSIMASQAIDDLKKDETDFDDIKYKIKKIVNYIKSNDDEFNDYKLIPLTFFIKENCDKEKFDFFINLLSSRKISNINELEETANKYNFFFIKEKMQLAANDDLYNDPSDLCYENLILSKKYKKYEKCELYNFDYLLKNPPLKLELKKITIFLKEIFKSNVFKDLFFLLTGNVNYSIIYNDKTINYLIDNIKFLPLSYEGTRAFFDKISLTTFISTMKKAIFYSGDKIINDKIIIALENAVIIEIEFHEFGHSISAIFSFMKNSYILEDTPRKKNMKINEAGYYIELALFGKVINALSYEEALYILNIKNYEKSLEEFKKGFELLEEKDLYINGPFDFLNIEEKPFLKKTKTIGIMAKETSLENIKKNLRINVPLKNDVHGRKFTIEDVLFYTNPNFIYQK